MYTQMGDFSDESDVNPSEMARMVDDLDDLDNALLGGVSKRQDLSPRSPDAHRDKEITGAKKKVAFKDFDHDDPLADLLGDDEASYDIKKPNVDITKSNFVADLFRIKNQKPEEEIAEPAKTRHPPEIKKVQGTGENVVPEEHPSLPIAERSMTTIAPRERSQSQNNRERSQTNEDFRTEDSQKLPSARARKSNLMEDLFGTRAQNRPKESETRPSFPKSGGPSPLNVASSEPPKSEPSTKSSSGYTVDSGTVRESRRGRRNSPLISDPLGLFSAPKEIEVVVQSAADVKPEVNSRTDIALPKEDLPEWLGGTAKGKETKSQNEKHVSCNKKLSEVSTGKSSTMLLPNTKEFPMSEPRTDFLWQKNQEPTIFCPDLSTMISTQFDQQAALISMQQQEHELKTAATLSNQNEAMAKIVENQRSKLDEQGNMFNDLIKHQLKRQSMLESQMKMQQARIDHYIRTLMSQPISLPIGVMADEKSSNENDKPIDDPECPESLVKALELEKVHLEKTIEILKDKHEEEIKILQESYEKQMLFLHQGTEKLEKKMCEDYEALVNDYEKKMAKLLREKDETEQACREEIDRLKKSNKTFIEEICARHTRNLELLQREHAETIDEISRAKEIERLAVDTINNRKTDLGDLLQRSQHIIENFQSLQKKLEDRSEKFNETHGTYLRKQEENLQLLRDQLNLQQESLVAERKRLLEISHRLDASSTELTAEFKRNSTTINETEERLATRERALIREKLLFDEQMKWEREHLQAIKEAWAKEQERQMKLILDEREAVAGERAKLEVYNKLKNSSEDMVKIELEIALKTAQEAADEAITEKYKWQEKCRNLDAEKRTLREKEKDLIHRAKELEKLTQAALKKRDEGLEALNEAKRIEQRHKDHLVHLQMQLESFAHREKKRATQKFTSARERLAAKIYPAEKPERDTAENVLSIGHVNEKSFASNSQVTTHFKDVVDPHLLLLKLNLDNKLDTTDELLSAMQVISQ